MQNIRDEAHKLIDQLPDDTSWNDFARLFLERLRIEEGLADLDAGLVWTSVEIREKLA